MDLPAQVICQICYADFDHFNFSTIIHSIYVKSVEEISGSHIFVTYFLNNRQSEITSVSEVKYPPNSHQGLRDQDPDLLFKNIFGAVGKIVDKKKKWYFVTKIVLTYCEKKKMFY